MHEPQNGSICNGVAQLPLSAGVLDDVPSWQENEFDCKR